MRQFYGAAIIALGLATSAVPEPSTWAMLLIGSSHSQLGKAHQPPLILPPPPPVVGAVIDIVPELPCNVFEPSF